MRRSSFLRSVISPLSRLFDRFGNVPRRGRPQSSKPALELLEDRLCPAIDTWTGAAAAANAAHPNDNWSDGANWQSGLAPTAGDTLVFGSGAASKVANNDFQAGTIFNKLEISGDGYTIQGNAVQLQNGISNSFGVATVALDITLGAAQTFIDAEGSSLVLSGSINNNGYTWTVNPNGGGDILFTGKTIRGSGQLVVEGDNVSGKFFLMNSQADSFTGMTTVKDGGVLFLDGAQGNSIVGDMTVGDGPGPVQLDCVHFASSNETAKTSNITVYQDGLFDLNGYTDTIGSLTMTGGFVTTGTGTLTLNGNVQTLANSDRAAIEGNLSLGTGAKTFTIAPGGATYGLTIKGNISGGPGAELIKAGTGAMDLSMDSSYSGSTDVTQGTLTAESTSALGSGGATVASGATLDFNDGSLGSLSINGNLSNSGTVEFSGGGTGTLTVHGNYSQAAGATLDMALAGTNAIDQMAITGKATLAGTLDVDSIGGFQLSGGNSFEIMTFASSSGSFGTVDLPRSNVTTLRYDAHDLTIVDTAKPITGGTGAVTPPAGADVWTGAGGNSYWANGKNWASGVAPVSGQALFFGANPASTVSKNNYTAGTTFGSIIIAGSGYDITGNAVTLTGDVMAENTAGSNTVALDITFTSPETITDANAGTSLVLAGTVTNGGMLTVNTNGNVQYNGPSITGTGGLTVQGNGTFLLADTTPDSYVGATEVQPGATLIIANSAALSSQTTVDAGATLELLAGVMVSSADSLTLNGDGVGSQGALFLDGGNATWNGSINLASTSYIGTAAGATLTIGAHESASEVKFGVITGGTGDNLYYVGNGTVILDGNDTYDGYTTVVSGILALANLNALNSASNNGDLGSAVDSGATIQLLAAGQYAINPLQLNGTGVGGQGALVSMTGNNMWTAPIKLDGNTTISCEQYSTFTDNVVMPNEGYALTINAVGNVTLGNTISGSGGLIKNGPGTLTLDGPGPNLYSGPTTVNAGELVVAKNSAFEVITGAGLTIEPGATLSGTGWINTSVTNNGVITPAGTNNTGSLVIHGNYTQSATGALDVELASLTALDQVMISGTATLGGTLNVSLLNGFQPAPGNDFEAMSYKSFSGNFARVNLPTVGIGVSMEANADPMDLMIQALATTMA